jgi:hypothetical protein
MSRKRPNLQSLVNKRVPLKLNGKIYGVIIRKKPGLTNGSNMNHEYFGELNNGNTIELTTSGKYNRVSRPENGNLLIMRGTPYIKNERQPSRGYSRN